MGYSFMSVAFGRNPVIPMPRVPIWIIERHNSPGSLGAGERSRH